MRTATETELEALRRRVRELEAELHAARSASPNGGSRRRKAEPRTVLPVSDVLANLPVALVVVDRTSVIRFATPAAAAAAGKNPEQLVGSSFTESLAELLGPELTPHYIRMLNSTPGEVAAPVRVVQATPSRPPMQIEMYPCEDGLTIHWTDISEQAAAGLDIAVREQDLRDLFENAAIGIHWVGADGTILWANRAELKLLGYSSAEYIGRNIRDFHADESTINELLARLERNEQLDEYEARLRCKDGTIRRVAITSNVYWRDGRFVHTRCFTRDITDRAIVHELQQRLAAIVESSDDAIISKDLQGIVQTWNRGAERIFGYTAEEMIGQPIARLAVPHRADEMPAILERLRRGERVAHFETERRAKDGRVLKISLAVSPVRDASGRIMGAAKVARDITDRKNAAELQERLAAIVESSDDAIISKDLNGIIRSWNRGAQRIFGYTAEEVIGQHVSILSPPDRATDEIPEILERISRGERVEHFETKRRTKAGETLTMSLTVSPIRDASGVIVGASKIARNVTQRERDTQALREANAALSRSNADLEHFAYSASHDLQEPLRMVATYSAMLKRKFGGKLGPSGDEYISYTIEGATRMEQLIRDLLAYTRASTYSEKPVEDASAGKALERTLLSLRAAISSSGAVITHTDLPSVRMYQFQLEQLLQNLVGNAIRYRSAEPPRIHIAAEQRAGEWLFSVQDNGIGIDPQYKEQIFGIFKRLHNSGDYPGTGMGLAICQRIVERVGGRIWVESELGRGATFFFTVPIMGHG